MPALPHHHSDHSDDPPQSPLNLRRHPKILPGESHQICIIYELLRLSLPVIIPAPEHLSGVKEYVGIDEDDIISPITPHSPTSSENSFASTDFAVVVR